MTSDEVSEAIGSYAPHLVHPNRNDEEVARLVNQLRDEAAWFWTEDVWPDDPYGGALKHAFETRSAFIDLLCRVSSRTLLAAFVDSAIPLPVVVKHCMLATNTGKELLDRVQSYLRYHGISRLTVTLDCEWSYRIRRFTDETASDITGKDFFDFHGGSLLDMAAITCYAAFMPEFEGHPSFRQCRLGSLCGDENACLEFFSDLYIRYSQQTQGRMNNLKGHIVECNVHDQLETVVDQFEELMFVSNKRVPDVPESGESREFDRVLRIDNGGEETYIAITIQFQETGNSTLERKGEQARTSYPRFCELDYYLCCVIDGAGYLERETGLKKMVQNSHLAVSLNRLETLQQFIIAIVNHVTCRQCN